jgi:DNA-binding MarR family transcriptional regulator
MRELDQPGIMRLLLAVNKAGGRLLEKGLVPSDFGITQGQLNLAVEKLIKLNLVRRVQSHVLLHTGDLELTEKGRLIASRLIEVSLSLAEGRRPSVGDDLGNLPVARNLTEEETRRMMSAKRDLVFEKTSEMPRTTLDETRKRAKGLTHKLRKPKRTQGGK